MADQQRWFKLWCAAPSDDALQALPGRLRWAWAALGCHTKVHGTRGRVTIHPDNAALAAQMDVPLADLKVVISGLPNVSIEEGKNRHGSFIVTWKNWTKYQVDSTQAQRAKTSRSKRRREERRRDLSFLTEALPLVADANGAGPQRPGDEPGGGAAWPDGLAEVQAELVTLQAPAAFADVRYWQRIDAWLGPADSGVAYLAELARYLAWHDSLPAGRRQKNLKLGFRNWLTKAERDAHERARRETQDAQKARPRRP